ncbi:MAG: type II toxin-antitoxin system VapC family toxin [Oscillatoria princeps RMCB-10]|jgi:predicted nucleic acid-binding protein|nr:type II toxin-antitoxin system VapC family toxin [Oscillatoria princeps RMCB-10]
MTASVICVDANFVVRLVSREPPESPYRELWIQWQDSGRTIVAPTLIYYEVSNALHRMSQAGQLLPERASQALEAAFNLNVRLYGDAGLHRHALNMAATLRLPATYDAHYLALAEQLSAEFCTADRRLFQAVRSTFSWVHLVGES